MDICTWRRSPRCILNTTISKAGTANQQDMGPRSRRISSLKSETCADSHLHGRHDIFLIGQMRPRPSKRFLWCCSRSRGSEFHGFYSIYGCILFREQGPSFEKHANMITRTPAHSVSQTSVFSCSSTERNTASAARCRLLLHHSILHSSKRPKTSCGVSIQLERY